LHSSLSSSVLKKLLHPLISSLGLKIHAYFHLGKWFMTRKPLSPACLLKAVNMFLLDFVVISGKKKMPPTAPYTRSCCKLPHYHIIFPYYDTKRDCSPKKFKNATYSVQAAFAKCLLSFLPT